MTSPSAIPPGSTVLVTGVNGFIGSHVANEALKAGYRVRGTVRSEDKARTARGLFEPKHGNRFEAAVVPDISKEGAFDEALKDTTAVAHIASDLSLRPNPHEVISPMLAALDSILTSAAAVPTIKRFVYTSSSTAATMPKPNVRFTVTDRTWNDEAVEKAWAPPPYTNAREWDVYGASKTQAEKECWKFVREKKPGFVLNTVLPNYTTGEDLFGGDGSSTGRWAKGLWNSDPYFVNFLHNFAPQYQVDIRDIARLHLAGLTSPSVQNERIMGFGPGTFNFNTLVRTMRTFDPQRELPAEMEDPGEDLSTVVQDRTVEILRGLGREGWTSMEQSLRENCLGVA